MVAVISGNGLGLLNSSLSLIGARGGTGSAGLGQGGSAVFVNSATGNLLIQGRDEFLSATGADLTLVRTYNSQGLLNDDNADNWQLGVHRRAHSLTGTVNTVGSSVRKTFGDGAEVLYTYDSTLGRYVSTEGDGAHDTLQWSSGSSQWTWTDGSGRGTEVYDSAGRLLVSRDTDGNTTTYAYTGSLLTQITDSSGQVTFLDYTGTNLTQVRTVISGATQTRTRYGYDGSNRLTSVTFDLTPADNAIADGRTFVTTYAYDGTSKRVASITHSDGTAVSFTYELSGGLHRVKTYTDGEGKVTTLTYSGFVAAPTTAVANGAALSTTDTVTATNNYSLNGGALTTPPNGWGGATLRESTTSATNDPRVAFDANGNGVLIYRVGSDIKAQRYTRATNSWSAEVTLDTRTNTTYAPSLSVDAGGNAIAAWVQSDGTANSVYAARFDGASGTWGAPALIDGSTATFPVNTAANSLVTSISGTRASVAWQHNVATTGSVYDLYVARFNGTSWAAAELVDARTNNAAQPSVAIDNQGNVTVAFQQSDGTANSIYANRFTASSGTWSGAVLRESTTSATNDPRVAFDANGNGVLIYRVGSDIKAQRYTRATNSWSAEVTLDTRTNTTYAPSLSVDAGGNAIAAWVQSDGTANSVYAARVDGASGTWGAPALIDGSTATFPVNTAANSLVTSISGTRASVAWRHNVATTGSVYDLYVARFNGTSWAAAELVDARTNNAAQPSVAIDNQGNVTVAFQQSDGTANSIYTNRYLSGGAAYYTIPSGATWQSIASTLYGINSAAAGTALQTAMGNPPLVVGNQMSGWPATLSVTSTTTTTVPPYYTVQSGNTWTSITQTVYGTSDTAAVAALQSAMGNPTLTVGLKLTVPSTLSYTSASGPQIAQTIDVSSSLGLVTTLQNDTQGRLTALLSPTVGGSRLETRFAYDGSGNVSSVTEDPTGRNLQTVYGYDASGNLLSSRDARGNTVTRTYSATNQVLTETAYTVPDPDGAGAGQPSGSLTTRYVYDGEEHLRFVVTGEGRVTEYRYDAAGNRTAMLVYTGGKYDVSALAATASLTESQLTSWVSTQNLTQLQRTDYGYDFRGNLSNARTYATTDALGVGVTAGSSITRYVYDQRGLLLQTIDARGEATGADPNDFVTNYTYDSLGRMLTSVRWTAAGNVTTATNVYNDAARTATVTLSNGLITTTTFDRVGRVVSMAASGGAGLGTTTYTYDADGRLRMVTDPLGVKSHVVYDAAGRKSFTVDGTGTLTEYIYDRTSNLVKTVEYAAAANVALLTDAGGAPLATVDVTALRTSASGNPSADRITRAVYDAANRVVFTIDAAGNVVKNFYDGASRVTDALAYAAPVTIARTVDALTLTAGGDISGVTLNGSDANNRLTRMFYDAEGRLLATLDGAGYLVENVYDAAGRLLQTIAYADATPVGFRASGTLAQLRPAADTETAIDFERDIVSWYFYDGHGRRVGQLDGEGYLTEWTYDAAGNVASQIRYPSVRTWTGTPTLAGVKPANTSGAQIASFQYDEQNRVTQETDHQGTVTQYQYDTVGNLTRTTRALGTSEARVSQARYDLLGRVVAELTPEGSAAIVGGMTPAQIDAVWTQYGVSYAYNAAGQRVSMTDQYGNVTLYFYDADNRLRFAVNALGEVAENRYNALGQVTEKIAYANRIATSTLAGGAINATLTTRVTAAADAAKDAKTTYTYALNGRLASETTAEGGQITYAYNAFNELQSSTQLIEGATSVVTQYEYDTRGLTLRQRTDPSGLNLLEQTSYNAFGQAVSVTDARGNVRYLRHDRNGRTVTSLDAFGKSTNTSYDAFDRVLTVTDRLGNATTYVYNDTTRSVVVTTQEGVQLTTVMNRHGQTATITDGRGTVTTYEYDANGQLKRTFDTLGNRGQQTYDRAGRAVDTIDANGVITRITYDAASRVYTRTVDPGGLNLTTTYGYDGRGQAITVTDERGVVTTTAYDREGNVVTVAVDPTGLNLRTTYAYDKRGLLRVTTEGAGSANPRTVTYAYDAAGRRTSETVVLGLGQPDAVTQYKYDANGNLTRRIDARNFSTWYVYDVENRLRYTVDALGGVTQTSYDDEGRVTAMRRHATAIASGTVAGYGDVVTLAVLGTPATSNADRLEETVYDRDGRDVYTLETVNTSGSARVTARTFDASGNVVTQRLYANSVASGVARTIAGVTAALVPNGSQDREAYTAYDIRNRATFDIDALGAVTRLQYDAAGQVVSKTAFVLARLTSGAPSDATMSAWAATNADARDRTTRYWYDTAGRLAVEVDPEGFAKETRYSDATRTQESFGYVTAPVIGAGATLAQARTALAAVVNAMDRYAKTEYDAGGRVWRVTDAYTNYEQYSYDAVGNRLTFRNKKGNVWTYGYDANRRLVEERTEVVALTSVVGNGAGLLANAVSSAVVTKMTYDALGNVRTRTEGFGLAEERTTTYEYDALGRQTRTIYPSLSVYSAPVGDETRAGVAVVRAEASVTPDVVVTYNALGDAVVNKDVAGNYSHKTYDRLGRVEYEVDSENFVTLHVYDVFGNETQLTRYANRLNTGALTLSAVWSATQISGALTLDANADRTIAKTYDRLNRTKQVLQPSVYNYLTTSGASAGGTAVSAGASTSYDYNAFGEVVRTRDVLNPSIPTYADTYSYYDRRGLRTASVDALGHLTTLKYDALGNVVKQTDFAHPIAAWDLVGYSSPEQVPLAYAENANDTIANGVVVTGNSAKKASGAENWDSGFRSRIGYTGGATVTYTVDQTDRFLMVGLNSDPTSDNSYSSIDYALYTASGYIYVYQNGTQIGSSYGAYAAGDVFSVSYDGTTVRYSRNGVQFYSTAASIGGPLFADSSFYSVGGSISGLEFRQDLYARGVVATGSSVSKRDGVSAWDAGFRSKVGYVGGAVVSFTAPQVDKNLMVGLNSDPASDDNYTSIDYAVYLTPSGQVFVYESGVYIAGYGAYSTNDQFTVAYEGGRVRYYKNGVVFREVTVTIAGALYADSSLYEVGTEIADIRFGRSADDREVTFAYDRLDRKTSESRVVSDLSGLTRDRATTQFGYDAVGNQTSITDAFGAATYTYYDVLGRAIATAEPMRDVDGGAATTYLTPLTVMSRDAHGNLVRQVKYARGATTASSTTYTLAGTDAADRTTLIQVDKYGYALKTVDPEGAVREASYTVRGETAKEWQSVYSADNVLETLVTIRQYDKLGREIAVVEPQKLGTTNAVIFTQVEYNAFGEISRKGVNGTLQGSGGTYQEYFDYDRAGRVWRTNSGDGVNKVYLYNLAGQVTAEIRSLNRDLRTYVSSPAAALALPAADQVRTETVYDSLGRAVEQRQPTFSTSSGAEPINATFAMGWVDAPANSAAIYQRIFVNYGFGTFATYVVNPTATLAQDGGWYLNASGAYQQDTAHAIVSAVRINWSAPTEAGVVATFEYRAAGSTDPNAWGGAPVGVLAGNKLGVDVTGLTNQAYEYRVRYRRPTEQTYYAEATGSFTVTGSTSATLTVAAGTPDPAANVSTLPATNSGGIVTWAAPADTSVVATFRVYVPATGWNSLGATRTGSNFQVDLRSTLATAGTYNYEIIYQRSGATIAYNTGVLSSSGVGNSRGVSSTLNPEANFVYNEPVASPTAQSGGLVGAVITESEVFQFRPYGQNHLWNGTNRVSLTWADIGAGQVRVQIDYMSRPWEEWVNGGTDTMTRDAEQRTFSSANISSGPGGASVSWDTGPGQPAGGITQILAVRVYKETSPGVFTLIYSQPTPAVSYGRALNWAPPAWASPPPVPTFEFKQGAGAYSSLPVVQSTTWGVNLNTVSAGAYDYRITYRIGNRVVAQQLGTMSITAGGTVTLGAPSNTVYPTSQVSGVVASADQLSWSYPAEASSSVVVQYAYTGASSASGTRAASGSSPNYSASFSDVTNSGVTVVYYWIKYLRPGETDPYALALGRLNLTVTNTVVQPTITIQTQAAVYPSGVQAIAAPTDLGSNWLGWTTAALGGATILFRYRVPATGMWTSLPTQPNSSGYKVDLSAVAGGTYEYEITYTASGQANPYARGFGNFTISRSNVVTGFSHTANAPGAPATVTYTPRVRQLLDRWGAVVTAIDAQNFATRYRYDNYGQLLQIIQPQVTSVSTAGGVVTTTAPTPASRPTRYNVYDSVGRLIATRDANGNVNRLALNAAGQVLREYHADGGEKGLNYDAFGQNVQVTDELGWRTVMTFDRNGRQIRTQREIAANDFISYDYKYDEAGRRIRETSGETSAVADGDGGVESTRYFYDLAGNVILRRSELGRSTAYEYDLQGNKTKETNAISGVQTWSSDYFGRVQSHVDLGSVSYAYAYNQAGLQATQTSSAGQNLTFTYNAAAMLTGITDSALSRVTTYVYDGSGRRAREKTVINGLLHQDTTIGYDALGRVSTLTDLRYALSYSYDAQGNRTRISSTYYDHQQTQQTQDLWYTYDSMNRVLISQGVNTFGQIGINQSQGVQLTYDLAGQRKSATQWGTQYIQHYASEVWSNELLDTVSTDRYELLTRNYTDYYNYDGAGRLKTIDRSGEEYFLLDTPFGAPQTTITPTTFRVSSRTYDRASRETLDETLNVEADELRARSRATSIDDDGRMTSQTTTANTGALGASQTESVVSYNFDNAGVLRSYVVNAYNTGVTASNTVRYTSTYTNSHKNADSYLDAGQSVASTGTGAPQSGATTRSYNVNNELSSFVDTRDHRKDRFFANNASGQALTVIQPITTQNGTVADLQAAFQDALLRRDNSVRAQYFFFANGQAVGSFGQLQDASGKFTANFDVNYTPVSDNYPSSAPPEIVAQSGDTLRVIAARVWGDPTLWYLIAEENGLTDPDAQIEAGTVVRIPNEVISLSNAAGTFKPFDANEAIGDTTPTQPAPPAPKKKGCGVLGQILVIVVAIVVTIYTAGAAASAIAPSASATAAGVSAGTALTASQTFALGASVLSGTAGIGAGATLAAAAIGGAIGSVASQGVAIAAGLQDSFSWKGVALGAVGAAIGAGLGGSSGFASVVSKIAPNPYAAAGVSAAAGSIITQGVSVALGLQPRFDWRSVAVAAISGPVNRFLDGVVTSGMRRFGTTFAKFASDVVTGASSSTIRVALGGKFDAQQVMSDIFGNALANSVVDRIELGTYPPSVREAYERDGLATDTFDAMVDGLVHPEADSGLQSVAVDEARSLAARAAELGVAADNGESIADRRVELQRDVLVAVGATPEVANRILGELGFTSRRAVEAPAAPREPASPPAAAAPSGVEEIEEIVVIGRRIPLTGVPKFINDHQNELAGVGEAAERVGQFLSRNQWASFALTAVEFAAGPLLFVGRRLLEASPVGTLVNNLQQAAFERAAEFVHDDARVWNAGKSALIVTGGLAALGLAVGGTRGFVRAMGRTRSFVSGWLERNRFQSPFEVMPGTLGSNLGNVRVRSPVVPRTPPSTAPMPPASGGPQGPYRGGSHRDMAATKGDGLDSHHMPDRNADPRVSTADGPAIQMDPWDHAKTSSNGRNGASGTAFRDDTARMIENGRYRDAMAREVRDVRRASLAASGSRTKYNEAMGEMLAYARQSGQLPPNPKRR